MGACPVDRTCSIIGKRWTFFLLEELAGTQSKGFAELQKRMDTISSKVLAQRLDELELQGLVLKQEKHVKNALRTNYTLTEKGTRLHRIMHELKSWNAEFGGDPDCPRRDCATCPLFKQH